MKKWFLGLLAAISCGVTLADIDDSGTRVLYTAAASQTSFDYPFEITTEADLKVYVDDVLKTLTTHYTVAGEGDDAGGSITLLSALTGGEIVTLYRDTEIARSTDFSQNAGLTSASFNREYDKLFAISQELENKIGRSIRIPQTSVADNADIELEPIDNWLGKVIQIDANGEPTPVALVDLEGEEFSAATIGELLYPQTTVEDGLDITPTLFNRQVGDPRRYGATANGTTDDSVNYAVAESAAVSLFLDNDTTYNMGSTKPVDMVHGPGAIKLTGSSASPTISGFEVGFDVAGGSILAVPEVWAEQGNGRTSTPGGINDYFNVIIAPGSNAGDKANVGITRSVIIGEAAGEEIIEWERVEAIGSGSMRFAPYAQRTTCIGTLSCSWMGATSEQFLIDNFHDFFIQDDLPGEAGWDFVSLETRGPGIGQQIDDFASYATGIGDVTQNVCLGRDACLHLVTGSENTAVGYQAGAHWFEADGNAAFGENSLRDGVFTQENTGLGNSAGIHLQEGLRNIFIGHEAGENFVEGDRNIFLGTSSGADHTHGVGHAFDNKFVMEMNTLGTYLVGDLDIGSLFLALEENDLDAIDAKPSGFYNVVSLATTPATPGRFLGTATDTVSTFNSYAGSASARTHATFENTNGVVGTIVTTDSGTAYNTSSDMRDKIAVTGSPDSLAKINALDVHLARFKTEKEGLERAMLFAQEAEKITPYAVSAPSALNDRYQMDYSKLVPDLVLAVQTLSAQVEKEQATRRMYDRYILLLMAAMILYVSLSRRRPR